MANPTRTAGAVTRWGAEVTRQQIRSGMPESFTFGDGIDWSSPLVEMRLVTDGCAHLVLMAITIGWLPLAMASSDPGPSPPMPSASWTILRMIRTAAMSK